MNLVQITDGVLEHFNYRVDDSNSDTRRRIVRHINEWHRRIMSKDYMDIFRRGTLTVASVASTPTVAIPDSIGRVVAVRDTANRITLREQGIEWYRAQEPDPSTNTGTPTVYVVMGFTGASDLGVASTGTGIWVASSSASDSGKLTVEGVRLGGYEWSERVTLNGTSRVQAGALTDWVEVTRILLDSEAVGTVSLYKVSVAGSALATIPIGATTSRYKKLALWPTPSTAYSYEVDYRRPILDMLNDGDVPLLPEDFHWLLAAGARCNEYERTKDERYALARADLDRGIGALVATLHSNSVLVPKRSGMAKISRISGWAPADTVVYR